MALTPPVMRMPLLSMAPTWDRGTVCLTWRGSVTALESQYALDRKGLPSGAWLVLKSASGLYRMATITSHGQTT
jgi:hypothetical protein